MTDRKAPSRQEVLEYVARRAIRDLAHALSDLQMRRYDPELIELMRSRKQNFESIVGNTSEYRRQYLIEMTRAEVEAETAKQRAEEAHAALKAMSAELKRLREIEHLAWHLMDDSEENATTGEFVIRPLREDALRLSELLPEEHPVAKPSDARDD